MSHVWPPGGVDPTYVLLARFLAMLTTYIGITQIMYVGGKSYRQITQVSVAQADKQLRRTVSPGQDASLSQAGILFTHEVL